MFQGCSEEAAAGGIAFSGYLLLHICQRQSVKKKLWKSYETLFKHNLMYLKNSQQFTLFSHSQNYPKVSPLFTFKLESALVNPYPIMSLKSFYVNLKNP